MDFAVLRELLIDLLRPIQQELHSQNILLTQLSQDMSILKARDQVPNGKSEPNRHSKNGELETFASIDKGNPSKSKPENTKKRDFHPKSVPKKTESPRKPPLIRQSASNPPKVDLIPSLPPFESPELPEKPPISPLPLSQSIRLLPDFCKNPVYFAIDEELKGLLEVSFR